MNRSHFFDIDILLKFNSQPWIIDRSNPTVPIMKISQSDFNVYQSGIFRKQGNKLEFNDKVFWLPTTFWEKLKVKAKIHHADVSNLAISLQEYMNKELIDQLDFDLNMDMFKPIINSGEDIYIICSRNTKTNYQSGIEKLQEKMKEIGLSVKAFYYVSEIFFNKNDDSITFKKTRLVMQHLIGMKTDGLLFTDEQITQYSDIFYYDNDFETIKQMTDINNMIQMVLSKTENAIIKDKVEEIVKQKTCRLHLNYWTGNQVNKFKSEKIDIKLPNLARSYESFMLRK